MNDVARMMRNFAEAYPESVFPPIDWASITQDEKNLVSRASASMGRHFAKFFLQAADEIERLEAQSNPEGGK
jgi:hypothetical protein